MSTQEGFTVYRYPAEFTSVTLGDTECITLDLIEVAVNAQGKGWVITKKKLDGTGAKTMSDNTPREYLYYGQVTVS